MKKKNNKPLFVLILSILTLAFALRIYKLDDLMPFIGDFAWFYISARDMILDGNFPLVGIASSHTWVHQGSLWTYLLAIPLLISDFNPVSGAYFTAALGTITVFMIYKIGTQMFSRLVGVVAATLYVSSPLVVIHARLPYHTSLIPLASLLFILFLYKWIKGDVRFFPLVFFSLGVLYNLELATMVFWTLILLVLAFGSIKRERWFREAMKFKTVLFSIFLFLLVMLPMIIYDFKEHSGFYQTTAFFRLINIYLFSQSNAFSFEAISNVFTSLFAYNNRLVFLANGALAFLFTLVSFFYLTLVIYKRHKKKKSIISFLLLGLWVTIPLSGIILSKTASEAYIPMLFPAVILSISLLFKYIYKRQAFIAFVALIFIVITNGYLLVEKNYFMGTAGGYGLPFSKRLSIAKEIVNKSKGREYNLVGKGEGSEHKSFTMNYEYLTWWIGHGSSEKSEELKIIIQENKAGIHIKRKIDN